MLRMVLFLNPVNSSCERSVFMIGVIEYKAGNAPSVLNSLHKLNDPAELISSPRDISTVKGIILPGVGSAGATMDSLRKMGFLDVLEEKVLNDGVPFLGICIGLQILFDHSEEGDTECLGWIPGNVRRFPEDKVRVPQIGWNEVKFIRNHAVISGLNESEFFYFVNSYYVTSANEEVVLARTQYGVDFCSMISYKNIFGAQFHIEKSGVMGLRLLKNFSMIAEGVLC